MDRDEHFIDALLCRNVFDLIDHHRRIAMSTESRRNGISQMTACCPQPVSEEIPELCHACRLTINIQKPNPLRNPITILYFSLCSIGFLPNKPIFKLLACQTRCAVLKPVFLLWQRLEKRI